MKRRDQGRLAPKSRKTAPPKAIGRPAFVLTAKLAKRVQHLAGLGLTNDDIAVVLGIHPSTLYAHVEEFSEHLRRGRATARMQVRQSVFRRAVEGSLGHAIFWSKIVDGWREASPFDGTGFSCEPVSTTARVYTDDEIRARLMTLVERHRSVMAVPMAMTSVEDLKDDLPDS